MNYRLLTALSLLAAATPVTAQIKTFKAGEPAKASEVNSNFNIVKSAADAAGATAAAAAKDAADAKSIANSVQADVTKNKADIAKNKADIRSHGLTISANRQNTINLRNRKDLTTTHILTDIVSRIDGVRNDGGNIDFVAGTGMTITPNDALNRVTFSATPFNGGTIKNQVTIDRKAASGLITGLRVNTNTTSTGTLYGIVSTAGDGTKAASAWGIQGYAHTNGGSALGVVGYAWSRSSTKGIARGVYGSRGSSASNHYSMYSSGRFVASGQKSFIHPHPKDPTKLVEFSCLEGNESGTYFRGTARVRGGSAKIDIPDSWRFVTAKEKLTVHLTPIKSLARIAVWEMTRDRITVRADEDCEFSYIVHGVREGFEKHEAIKPNRGEFKPEIAGIPYGQEYTRAYRNLMVRNGTLNADYTPNLETAARKGWRLREPTMDEMREAMEREASWQQDNKVKAPDVK